MENNKKTMFISGMIGIGIGLFISGIVLSFLTYNVTNKNGPNITNHEHINNNDVMEKPKVTEVENITADIETEEIKREETEEIKIEETEEITNIDSETIEIEINETATASQIAELLEKEGVISDANEFLSYIVSKKAARTLIHGTKTFEINSDYETALEVLMIYK